MRRWMPAVGAAIALLPLVAARGDALAQAQIRGLLDAISSSGCEFAREGIWYPGAVARMHLEHKLSGARTLTKVDTPESFIALVASTSSSSGQPYLVRCPPARVVRQAGPWLNEQLAALRGPKPARGAP